MNRIIIIICVLLPKIIFSQTPANDSHWQLKWADEFDTFNTNRWIKANIAVHDKEPQLYLGEQVWTSNGLLVIEINNTKINCPNPAPETWPCEKCVSGKQYNYRSGFIQTIDTYNTHYGYIEARIKLPFRRENNKSWGFFPAFWTFIGVSGGSTPSEIDIFEVFGGEYKTSNTINTCIHRCYKSGPPPFGNPNCNNGDMSRSHIFSNFDYTGWHVYAIEWNANRLIWYLDGKAIRTTCNHQIVDPVRIILNLAIQSQPKYHPPTSPAFTEYMYVDYVRVYSLRGTTTSLATVVNEISNFTNYDNLVKKSITMSNATTIPSGTSITLRATDFIQLNSGFEVQAGKELYLDVTPCSATVTAKVEKEAQY